VKAALAASALAFAFAPAGAQTVSGGTSGTARGTDVSAGTCGQGSTTGSSVEVSGCADATAANGGTVKTSNRARTNSHIGIQNSRATARDEDERARSMTHTQVRQGETVRSRTMTMYKQRGERPVRQVITNNSTPQTSTTKKKPQ
jgi:hypothetical protein